MYLDFHIYFSGKNSPADVEVSLLSVHNWLMDIKKLGNIFSHFYYIGATKEKALLFPLQSDFNDFMHFLRKNDNLNDNTAFIHLWREDRIRVTVNALVRKEENCICSLQFFEIMPQGIEDSRALFDAIALSAFENMSVKYILQWSFKNHGDLMTAKTLICWSIYAHANLLRPLPGYPSYYLSDDVIRVSSVEELFDPANPEHVKKARALDREINSNARFVKLTGFVIPPSYLKNE
jgi:hypothetical protein